MLMISRLPQELNGEVSRASHECTVLKKELQEHKVDADRRQQRLLEDLRQTEDQRAHLDKLYHSSTAKVAEVESELAHVRQDLSHQVKVLREKLEKEIADKDHQQVQEEWRVNRAREHLAKHVWCSDDSWLAGQACSRDAGAERPHQVQSLVCCLVC